MKIKKVYFISEADKDRIWSNLTDVNVALHKVRHHCAQPAVEVCISWEADELKATITESQFDALTKEQRLFTAEEMKHILFHVLE